MKRVLVIDDEHQIRRLLKISLEKKDYTVFEAATGFEGIQEIQQARPDLILLDLNLPDMNGLNLLKEVRKWSTIPVIILSVRSAEEDIVALLDAGADDYLVKPFNTAELIARMKVALRHQLPDPRRTTLTAGPLFIDFEKHTVLVNDKVVKLTPTEYSILKHLALSAGKIITQDKLLKELWGPISEAEKGSLRVHIASLRKKIEHDPAKPELLITEPGIGYRLVIDNGGAFPAHS